jgi:hypothetical protein
MSRRVGVVIAIVAVLLAVPSRARAEGDLRIESSAEYVVDIDESLVHVEVIVTLTNLKEPTSTGTYPRWITYYYYDEYQVMLPASARNIAATQFGNPADMTVETVQARDIDPYQLVSVTLNRNLNYQQTQTIVFRFDLPGQEPRSDELTRVNPAYVGFPVWGWGDSGISTVTIRIDRSFYDVVVAGPDMDVSYEGDTAVYTQDPIEDIEDWFVIFTARRDSALLTEELDVGGIEIHIRSWPGDDEWAAVAHEAVVEGVPELQELIGLELDTTRRLEIMEALDATYLGYAGWYDVSLNRIEIGEDIGNHLLLHEISHAWFNDDLFTERWILEGLAEEYSWRANEASGLNVDCAPSELEPQGDEPAFPLNEWEVPRDAPIDDEETQEYEEYGYTTSWHVIHALVDEIGTDDMAAVFAAAEADETAYVGEGNPESVGADDDWRRLLDLAEEIGGSQQAEQLFRDYVVNEEQAELLDERAEAREAYADLVDAQDDLSAPWLIRAELSDWDFDEATELIEEAAEVVGTRNSIVALADQLGLDEPDSLEDAYEGATEDFDDAAELADHQLEAIEAVDQAADAVEAGRGFFDWVGLIGANPNRELDEAKAAFEADDIDLTLTEAAEVVELIDNAEGAGRVRVAWAGGGLGLLLLSGTTTLLWIRHRRGRAEETDEAAPSAESAPESEPTSE